MKRKYIYILPIAGVTSVAAAIAPTITSCSCSKKFEWYDEWPFAGSGEGILAITNFNIEKGTKYKFSIDLNEYQFEIHNDGIWMFIACNESGEKRLLPESATMKVNGVELPEVSMDEIETKPGFVILKDDNSKSIAGLNRDILPANAVNVKIEIQVTYSESVENGIVGFSAQDF